MCVVCDTHSAGIRDYEHDVQRPASGSGSPALPVTTADEGLGMCSEKGMEEMEGMEHEYT